jgi:epoxyqueuosine reductase
MNINLIKEYAYEIGIDVIGIASPYQYEKKYWINEKNEQVEFVLPQEILPSAKSIICVGKCYFAEDDLELNEPYGTIARYTWSNWYYYINTKLQQLIKFIKKNKSMGYEFRYFSCGPIQEKPIAIQSGIGWYGKNTLILTQNFGSWIVLGEIITDMDLPKNSMLEMDCKNCRICIEACPTHALNEYKIDVKKCLSHVMKVPAILPSEITDAFANRLYGCDTCQEVCPKNKYVKSVKDIPQHGYIGSKVSLIPILHMNEEEFREKYKYNQISKKWIRFESIQRNAVIALGNIRNPGAIEHLIKSLFNKSRIVRAHSARALSKFSEEKTKIKNALENARKQEKNIDVIQEINLALEKL